MKYRLGLDLGATSIGWAILKLGKDDKPTELVNLGSRVFSSGRVSDNFSKKTNCFERKEQRHSKRTKYRRIRRRTQLLNFLESIKILNREQFEKSRNLNVYKIRKRAINEKVTLNELARILHLINKRRGFKSNRKEEQSKDSSQFKQKISNLKKELEAKGHASYGSFLAELHINRQSTRLKTKKDSPAQDKNIQFIPSREMYEHEFDLIMQEQRKHHKVLTQDNIDKIKKIIFFQRGLAPQQKGKCSILPEFDRAYVSLSSYELFRTLQTLDNLRYTTAFESEEKPLTQDQKQLLLTHLKKQKTLKFKKIRKTLKLDDDCIFNFETNNTNEIQGCATDSIFIKNLNKELWINLDLKTQDQIVDTLLTAQDTKTLKTELSKLNLKKDDFNNIIENEEQILKIKKKIGSLSKEAIYQILETKENSPDQPIDEIIRELRAENNEDSIKQDFEFLPDYQDILTESLVIFPKSGDPLAQTKGVIANPTVHICLNQLKKVVNALIETYGLPHSISIETAKELKYGSQRISKINDKQKKNKDANKKARTRLQEIFDINVASKQDILKYRLWEELGPDHSCVYTGKKIKCTDILSSDIEIEHILPLKRFCDDSFSNKTLCYSQENKMKGNLTPYEFYVEKQKDKEKYEQVLARAKSLGANKYKKFLNNKKEGENFDENWISRHLNDTNYISKAATKYLKTICPKIYSPKGYLTAKVRHNLGLNTILNTENKKTRDDHRHHAIDALVIAHLDHKSIQQIMKNIKSGNEVYFESSIKNLREYTTEAIANTLTSQRVHHRKQGKITLMKPKSKNKVNYDTHKQIDFQSNHGKHTKYIPKYTTYCLIFWKLPNGSISYTTEYLVDILNKNHNDLKPDPNAKKIMTLRKTDIISIDEVDQDGNEQKNFYIIGSIGIAKTKIVYYPINFAGARIKENQQSIQFKDIQLNKIKLCHIDILGRLK